jgi:hypothetical protein
VSASISFALSRSRARSQKERESVKKECEKAKVLSAKEKSVNSHFFFPSTLETRSQSPKPLGLRKSKGLE